MAWYTHIPHNTWYIWNIIEEKSLKENVLIINMKSNSARGSEVINKTEGSINCDVLCI